MSVRDAETVLRVEKRDRIAIVTLNRPAKGNALNRALREAFVSAFEALAGDDAIEVLILTGAGSAFSTGLDLQELGSGGSGAFEGATSLGLPRAMARFPGPIIAAVNGAAVTGGFELALCCDVIVASRAARFADTHARVGVLPGWGISQRLSRTVGIYRAKLLSLTGNYIDAETAERWGLVSCLAEPAELMPTAMRIAADMLGCSSGLPAAYKRVIDAGFATTYGEGLRAEIRASLEHAQGVSASGISARRRDVIERGRTQS